MVKDDGTPYTVFTPYSKKWKLRLGNSDIPEFPSQKYLHSLLKTKPFHFPELNETGFMHNRVRMVTASFLTKHLLIDWRWGEAYFAEKLLDFELVPDYGTVKYPQPIVDHAVARERVLRVYKKALE